MKKWLILFFVGIFLIGSITEVLAISSDMKNSYAPGETIITGLSGSIVGSISKEQVKLKRGHVIVPFDYDLQKIGNKYYLWLIAPTNQSDYTLVIENVNSIVNGVSKQVKYEKNFSTQGELVDYSIKPGVIFTSTDFAITATVHGEDEITIGADFPEARDVVISPGENLVPFSIENVEGIKIITIKFGKYSIPAYIKGKVVTSNNSLYNDSVAGNGTSFVNQSNGNITNYDNITNNTTVNFTGNVTNQNIFYRPIIRFNPHIIRSTILLSNELSTYPVEILNVGEAPAEDVFLDYNKKIFYVPPFNTTIAPNSSVQFNLTLNNFTQKEIREIIYVKISNSSDFLLLKINFTSKKEEVVTSYLKSSNESVLYYCSELSGLKCGSGEQCSGQEVSSLDGACCVGKCETVPSGGGWSWVGYIIVGIVILAVAFIFLKYRKVKPAGNPITSRVHKNDSKLP
ncbi:MAG: hypothetical protein Q7S74_01430 [Nanoarchaeota archaeon]|nr:hypothetical protein [Nanoarchaeota archaeon]